MRLPWRWAEETMSKRLFLTCLTVGWICSVAGAILTFTTRSLLPGLLRDYLHSHHPSLGVAASIVWVLLSLAYISAAIAANVGSYFWRPWARAVYTMAPTLGWCLLLPVGNDPSVRTIWVDIASGLSAMFGGITICAMWFVPGIRDQFEKHEQGAPQDPPPLPRIA